MASTWSGRSTGAASSVPGTTGTPAAVAARRAASLSPRAAIARWSGPTKTMPGGLDRGRERCALGQEAVARVDGGTASGLGRGDDEVRAEVALGCRRRSEPHRRIGHPDVRRIDVGVAVDRHGLHPQLVTRPDDPDRDLPAVRDEDAIERPSLRKDSVLGLRLRAGCCHASSADWYRACWPTSPARR